VWVNGVQALRNGEATGAPSGRAVRGRAWTGAAGGGCRASARDWSWSQ
jgi:N-acyl-D-amino-acid deacylase